LAVSEECEYPGPRIGSGSGDKKPGRATREKLIATLLTIVITGALDAYAVQVAGIYSGSGIAFLYPGVAFMAIFGIWFGLWGAIGAYIGTVIGGLLTGVDMDFLFLMKTANFVQALIPALAYRHWHVTSDLGNKKSILFYFVICVVLMNLVGATVGSAMEGLPLFGSAWQLWVTANVFVNLSLLPLIMLTFSKVIEKSPLYVRGWY